MLNLPAITADQYQRRRLSLPKGNLRLADARVLRPILGYDVRKLPFTDEATRKAILDSAGWKHTPTGFLVSASINDTPRWGPLLHVSMSYADHDPSWEEIKQVRNIFFPANTDVMMMLPRQSDYINVHPHCFHLWQTPQEWRLL